MRSTFLLITVAATACATEDDWQYDGDDAGPTTVDQLSENDGPGVVDGRSDTTIDPVLRELIRGPFTVIDHLPFQWDPPVDDEPDEPEWDAADVASGVYNVNLVELYTNTCASDPDVHWKADATWDGEFTWMYGTGQMVTNGEELRFSAVVEKQVGDGDCTRIDQIEAVGEQFTNGEFAAEHIMIRQKVGSECESGGSHACAVEYRAHYIWDHAFEDSTPGETP